MLECANARMGGIMIEVAMLILGLLIAAVLFVEAVFGGNDDESEK